MKDKIKILLFVIITVILTAIQTGFVFNQYYKIQIEENSNTDFLIVRTLNYDNNSPLPNVTIAVLEHGEGRLLTGPYTTNESGYTKIQIPHGYEDYFDIVGDNKNVTNTITVDKRSPLVKSEAYLGSLGIGIIVAIISIIVGMLIERKRKKRLRKTKLKTSGV
jgi:hypothetical protein